MFTGIIEEQGMVKNIKRASKSIILTIQCAKIMEDMKLGDSIAVNGICLTVTEMGANFFSADVMPETMRKTNLGDLNTSDNVNLERALRFSDRLGGHIVSGHIDGTGVLISRVREDNAIWLTVEAQESIVRYLVMKGSVCLDGISLTVADVGSNAFKVSLIPMTAGVTTLGQMSTGTRINVECDIMAKYIEKLMMGKVQEEGVKPGLTMEFLRENGF